MRTTFRPDELCDILMKLVGEIEPIGETQTDSKRYENLMLLQNTVDYLIYEMCEVSKCSKHGEYSMSRAGKAATGWLKEKAEWILDFIKDGEDDER